MYVYISLYYIYIYIYSEAGREASEARASEARARPDGHRRAKKTGRAGANIRSAQVRAPDDRA